MSDFSNRMPNFPMDFIEEVETIYNRCSSVDNISSWFTTFDSLSKSIESGQGKYRQMENHIFELKVINFIRDDNPEANIIYEPVGNDPEEKNCDLLINGRQNYLIELKSFHPDTKVAPIPYEHITEGNEIIMNGHCYHDYQAVRGHLIDVTYDTEEKIKNYNDEHINVMGLLLGFYLHLEDLRDFVTIYRTRKYRFDDPLGEMTLHNLNENFVGNIHEFWGFPFQQVSFSLEREKTAVSVAQLQRDDKKLDMRH